MTLEEFKATIASTVEPPAGLSQLLLALWYCKVGRWHDAHHVAQEIDTKMGSWIHGLLHEIEGDLSNAAYWYSRAGHPPGIRHDVDEEWDRIATAVLVA